MSTHNPEPGGRSRQGETAGPHDEDVVTILLDQHARIRTLFGEVRDSQGERKQDAFDTLRRLLAVHETAEEMVLRPAAKKTAGKEEAEARNAEEKEANKVLAELERLDVSSAEFDTRFSRFEQDVLAHARHEEMEEFPAIESGCTPEQRRAMGKRLLTAERTAPTHPHPTAAGSPAMQWTLGPFASLLDRARDAFGTTVRK
ncbi:hemerythrin domain-containing protein [Streptomyces sp. NRRL F-5065]|uniref:hemerythrin domain-containing protein n=1 Tax=Streptomyces sp. NRRL F-5065 TaxID=1463855 RepID=UPI0004C129CA|nr:hemerythrin domain-containing protein [Streptomyces sp. NRRL F-5065]